MNSSRRSSCAAKRCATCITNDLCYEVLVAFSVPNNSLDAASDTTDADNVSATMRAQKTIIGVFVQNKMGQLVDACLVINLVDALLGVAVLVENLQEVLVDVLALPESILDLVHIVDRLQPLPPLTSNLQQACRKTSASD